MTRFEFCFLQIWWSNWCFRGLIIKWTTLRMAWYKNRSLKAAWKRQVEKVF